MFTFLMRLRQRIGGELKVTGSLPERIIRTSGREREAARVL